MRPLVRSYGEISSETRSPFMILMRLRRSRPAMVARMVLPASSSTENIPALNFSTTLPITSIASSFGKLVPIRSKEQGRHDRCRPGCNCLLPAPALASAAAAAAVATETAAATAALRLGTRFVNVERTAVDVAAVQAVDGSVAFGIHAHFHEREAAGLPCVTIRDDVHTVYRSV